MSHHHDHDHSGHDHDHSHPHDHSDEIEPAIQSLIWKQIDFSNIRTLNETETDAGRKIVEKSWRNRLDPSPFLVSDADEQLLMFVPFAGVLKLHSVLLRTSTSPSCPRTLKLYLNNDDLDFTAASELTPTQTLTVSQTNEVQEIPVKRALFGNTYSLALFVEDNYGDDACSRLYWVGFKGDFRELRREAVEVLYEKAANPRDHELVAGIGEMGGGVRHGV